MLNLETSSWYARTKAEKARARRLVAGGKARIAQTIHETYMGKRGIVSYEAWEVAGLGFPNSANASGAHAAERQRCLPGSGRLPL